jgi:hypothetical protein
LFLKFDFDAAFAEFACPEVGLEYAESHSCPR